MRSSYQKMITAYPGGWSAMAAAMGWSLAGLENRVYERKNQQMSVHDAFQIQEFSGSSAFAEAVAARSGGTFIKLPEVGAISNEDLFKKFQTLHVYLGVLSEEHMDSTEDGKIDKKERVRLEAIEKDIHRTLAELMAITYMIYCPDEVEVFE
ncbi:YmfL family putative regulatory protein [Oxalobacter formigenes]